MQPTTLNFFICNPSALFTDMRTLIMTKYSSLNFMLHVFVTISFIGLIFSCYLQFPRGVSVEPSPEPYMLPTVSSPMRGTWRERLWKPSKRATGFSVSFNWKRYVCPQLGSRLGNLMFQYASYYGVAFQYNLTLAMYLNDPIYGPFGGIPRPRLRRSRACNGSFISYRQKKPRYYEKFKIPRYGNVRLSGYLQSWKYFSKSFYDLKQQFIWKPNIRTAARRVISRIVSTTYPNVSDVITVGVHVRRGDYIREKRPVADRNYIENAKQYFLRKYTSVVFIVATNVDSEATSWCKENVINGSGVSVFSGFNHRFVDMAVLSMTDHIIISTGTYGWWAAFLNSGTVVHYDWIPQKHPKYNREDYILPYWVGIKPTDT